MTVDTVVFDLLEEGDYYVLSKESDYEAWFAVAMVHHTDPVTVSNCLLPGNWIMA